MVGKLLEIEYSFSHITMYFILMRKTHKILLPFSYGSKSKKLGKVPECLVNADSLQKTEWMQHVQKKRMQLYSNTSRKCIELTLGCV